MSLKHSFTVIAISETWISGDPVIPFHLPGYTFLHSDRLSGRGGGVGLFIKTDILFHVRIDISIKSDSRDGVCEYLFVNLNDNNSKYTVGVIYRKPGSNVDEFIEFYTEALCTLSRECLYFAGLDYLAIFPEILILPKLNSPVFWDDIPHS